MQKLFLALIMVVLMAGSAAAHGNISKLPFSVQILQYKMKLYMNEDDPDTINNLAMAYFYSGDTANAKGQLELILEKDPHNFNALDGMGMIYLKEKNSSKALEYLQQAQKMNGNDMYLLVHLAVAHGMAGEEEIAGKEMNLAKSLATGEYDMTWIENEINILNDTKKQEQ
jgi:tetratricopeptide (TPR) repeat protein